MSESQSEAASQAGPEQSKPEPPGKYLRERSRKIATMAYDPSIWNDRVKAGFPRVGEEIQIDMGGDRILVLKYKGTGRGDDLIFQWVGTVS